MQRSLLGLFLLLAAAPTACKKAQPPTPPPPTVRVVKLEPRDIELTYEWLATLDGSTNAEIRPRVTGVIESVNYQEGTVVRVDTLLFTIDKRPFVAAVEKARGDYQAALAQLHKSQADVTRYTPLVAQHALSRETLDNARAAVHQAEGNVEADKGNLRTAELNLQWTDVRSPINGIAGIAQTRVGNLVDPTRVLTTVSDVDPIRASIHISEREYLNAAQILNNVNDPRYANSRIIELILINNQVHPYTARRAIVGREIDPATGTLLIQALFPNPGNILRPGMFAKLRVHTGRQVGVLVVPERAVTRVQALTQVAVVDDQNRVLVRNVQLGAQINHDYVVQSGLSAGERVIVEGRENAPPGTKVNVETMPPAQASAGRP